VWLFDPDGEPVPVDLTDARATIALPESARDRPWRLIGERNALVTIEGTWPVFAFGRPNRYFIPTDARLVTADAEHAELVYRDGISGRGIQLNGSDTLTLAAKGPVQFDARKGGTIEFWVRPNWDAAFLADGFSRPLVDLQADNGRLNVVYMKARKANVAQSFWDLRSFVTGPGDTRLRTWARHGTLWSRDEWVHFALTWRFERGKFLWFMFLDGKMQSWSEQEMKKKLGRVEFTPPGNFTTFTLGAIDGTIDELRISSTVRYSEKRKAPFMPQTRAVLDEDTIAVWNFENNTIGQLAGGERVEMVFDNAMRQ
jgi:hypothetical protein